MKALLLALLLAPALQAQIVLTAGDASVSLAQVLRPHPEGLILTMPDAQGHSLLTALQAAAGEEPALPLQLTVQELEPAQPCGRELAALGGWGAERPHWALVGPDRRIHAEGTDAPAASALAESYGLSPLRAKADALRDFLRLHPDHGEAQAQLLLELKSLAERRAERAGKGQALLAAADDERIWSEYARRYETFFKAGFWRGASRSVALSTAEVLGAQAASSPRLRDLAERLMPEVEEALRAKPTDAGRWALWRSFRGAGAQGGAAAALAGVEPLPGARRWPPEAAVDAFVEDARARNDWRDAEPLLQASFDQNEALLRDLEAAARKDAGPRGGSVDLGGAFGFGQWNGDTADLVEAKLRLGKLEEADRIATRVLARAPRSEFIAAAAQLARDCGAEALADKWARMGRGGG